MNEPIPTISPASGVAPVAQLSAKNILAVASGKGGVGKTWMSITLCQALARMGKSILLFDGDLGLANVDIQLGLMPERDLGAVFEGKCTLQNAITKYEEGGFSVLAGRSGSGTLGTLSTQRLNDLRTHLLEAAKNFDTVVLDLGAGVDRTVRQLAGPARTTLVVVTDEPTSITDGYAFIKLAVQLNPNADIRIVINMAPTLAEGEKTYETIRKACQTFLNYSPALGGIIRRDPKVREAIRAQTPILLRSPTSDAALDVEALAGRLFDSL
ncbi:MAG: MinD/ParA family protein [Bdellovibrionales bacterium]